MYLKLNLPLWRLSSLYRLKILCVVLYAPLFLYGIDYTGRLPSQITLQNGVSQSHNLIAKCGNQYCYAGLPGDFINNAYDFSYSTSSGTSHLSIHAITPQNPINQTLSIFYVGKLNVGSNSNLEINDFHTISFQRGLTLNANSSLEIILQKGKKINASEFGASSKMVLSRQANLYLGNGANLYATNMDFFILDSQAFIDKNATMRVEADTIRIHNTLQNYGTLNIQGEVWNVGASPNGISLATSNFLNTEGKITIQGNFYNGGKPKNDGGFDFTSPGGGNLINYGGEIHITGQLVNQKGEELSRVEHSSVQIYGGSIKVDGSMTNAADSSLIFGAYNGKLGQLIGNVDNQGKIQVDIAGAELGSHQLITGTLSGNTNMEILAGGGKSEFINSSSQGNGSIKLEKNTQAIDTFLQNLDKNQNSILTSLESNLEQDSKSLYTYGDRAFLTNLSSNIDTSANILSTQAPSLSLWSIMQNTTLPLIYQPPMKRFSFNLAPFASNASSANLSTPLYGTSLSATLQQGLYSLSAFATYATSQGTSALDSTQTHLNSTALLIGTYSKLTLPKLELTLLAYYGNTQHTSKREVFFSSSTFQGKLSYNELGLQSTLGYPISFQKFHIKPFLGLSYTLGMQGTFAEFQANNTNMPTLSLKAQQHHTLSLLLGTQMRYYFGSRHILFGGLNLQYVPTPTQQTTAYFGNSPLYFQSPQTLGYTLHLGGSVPLHKHISLSLYALYAQSPMQFKTYSGTLNLSYYF